MNELSDFILTLSDLLMWFPPREYWEALGGSFRTLLGAYPFTSIGVGFLLGAYLARRKGAAAK